MSVPRRAWRARAALPSHSTRQGRLDRGKRQSVPGV